MKQKAPQRIVVYDGDCGFCKTTVCWMKSLDWLGRLEWRPRLEPGLSERFPALQTFDTKKEMVSLRPDGKAEGGFYALREVWIQLPLTFIPAVLFYIPGAAVIGVPVYDWVARNRFRFKLPKASCGLPE